MRILLTWTRGVVLLLVLSGAAAAETRVSQSNDPTATLNGQMSAILGQERAAISALDAGRLEQILTAPAVKAAVVPTAKPVQTQLAAVAPSAQPEPVKPRPFWQRAAKPEPAAPKSPEIVYDASWLAQQPVAKGNDQWACLAKALYFEARGESVRGQFAVAEVILNRVSSGLYPRSVCGVVNQGSKYACQFSFVCDGHSDAIHEKAAYAQAGKIAALMLAGGPRTLTDGATHFHTGAVRPSWSRTFTRTAKIGAHYFYRQPMRLASN